MGFYTRKTELYSQVLGSKLSEPVAYHLILSRFLFSLGLDFSVYEEIMISPYKIGCEN